MQKIPCPYGSWASTLSAELVAAASLRLGRIAVRDGALYWSEGRPLEAGRTTIMRRTPDGSISEILPKPFSARSKVHEYGGGEFTAAHTGILFINERDQQIYHFAGGKRPRRLTAMPKCRFADCILDDRRGRVIAVAERHQRRGNAHPQNMLCAIDFDQLRQKTLLVLREGADFYASPRLSPDGRQLAWLEWCLPAMPWDAARLMLARLDKDGIPGQPKHIAGGKGSAAFQPEWAADGTLYFVCDESGCGQLYAWRGGARHAIGSPGDADLMRPLWSFNARSYALLNAHQAIVSYTRNGSPGLACVSLDSGEFCEAASDLRMAEHIAGDDSAIAAIGMRDDAPPALIRLGNIGPEVNYDVVRETAGAALSQDEIAPSNISVGEPVPFTDLARERVYGIYYAPRNSRFTAMPGTRPPVIIAIHGGPTGASARGLKLRTQFFTQRGFAVFDLDYSGSTGYGRNYRLRLNGEWGVRDVADTEAAARHLIAAGLAARGKLFLHGSSAGGYTVLMALGRSGLFAGGVSAYGISDLAALQRTTHKFESGYIYGLTGVHASDAEARLRERSPLSIAGQIRAPLLLLQGLEDKVVPPEQSEMIAHNLARRNVPVEYLAFEGEGHGFRRAETLIAALRAELDFYRKILGISPEEKASGSL